MVLWRWFFKSTVSTSCSHIVAALLTFFFVANAPLSNAILSLNANLQPEIICRSTRTACPPAHTPVLHISTAVQNVPLAAQQPSQVDTALHNEHQQHLPIVLEIPEEGELPALNNSCKQHYIIFLRAGWLNIYM